jgi:hypothetical protein
MSYLGRQLVNSALGDITGNSVSVTGAITGHSVDSVATKTATYVVTTNDDLILANGTFTVTLYTAIGNNGREIEIRNIGTGTVTVAGNAAELIDAANTLLLTSGQALWVKSDNAQWWTIKAGGGTPAFADPIFVSNSLFE